MRVCDKIVLIFIIMSKRTESTNDLVLVGLAQNKRVGDIPTNFKVLFHAELILTGLEQVLHILDRFLEHIHQPDHHRVVLTDG